MLEYSPVYQEKLLPKKRIGGGIEDLISEEHGKRVHEGNKEAISQCSVIGKRKDNLCKEDILSQLECPVCFQTPNEGCFIFQCGWGHTICATCHKLLEDGPVYQEQSLPNKEDDKWIRSLFPEEYITQVHKGNTEKNIPSYTVTNATDKLNIESTPASASSEKQLTWRQLTISRKSKHDRWIVNAKSITDKGPPNKLK